jgi:hydroxymethylpyrimidine/phosphomethylpyrimidine kinase
MNKEPDGTGFFKEPVPAELTLTTHPVFIKKSTIIFVRVPSLYAMTSAGQERDEVLHRLGRAVELLAGSMDPHLLPGSGGNIGFAVRNARDGRDVASVRGGIAVLDGKFVPSGPCEFDTGADISRVVITVMKFDPEMRSAAVIRYCDQALSLLQDMSTGCCGVNRTKEPPGISTMDWGIASCCSEGVPGVIYDRGAGKSGGLIYCIGEDVLETASTIIILSHRIQ